MIRAVCFVFMYSKSKRADADMQSSVPGEAESDTYTWRKITESAKLNCRTF